MNYSKANIFNNILQNDSSEVFDTLLSKGNIRIERIVSTGQSSPVDFWYDQPEDEFVILLEGTAQLRFKEDMKLHTLIPGDYFHIQAHALHRVETTDIGKDTVWLAVHFQ